MKQGFICRSCGGSHLVPVMDMGETPLANRLIEAGALSEPEPTYPLDLVFCSDCSLVQITETVPPEVLFRDYLYFSSFSDTMVEHARQIVTRLIGGRALDGDSLAVEIASNDGYLLQFYEQANVPVLGIEPARNIAEVARRERNVRTLDEFFTSDLAQQLAEQGERADVVHANNVLAHVADLNGFVAGIATILKPQGVAVIEAPYVGTMIEGIEFDTIYHEHLCYYSLTALDKLFARHGLSIVDVEQLAIHGGSLRIFAAPAASAPARTPAVELLLAEEDDTGMTGADYYLDFASRVNTLAEELRALLSSLKAQGKSIAAYGASAKGSTLLNYFGIGADVLDFVADRSTVKQGLYTPGTHLPIVAPEQLLADQPDYVLLLTWNFRDEILEQQAAYRKAGGRFIVPIPELAVVEPATA